MKRVRIRNFVESAFYCHHKLRFLAACIILFIFIAIINIFRVRNIEGSNMIDVLFLSFCGPSVNNSNLAIDLQWLLIQLVLTALLGDFAFNQIFYKSNFLLVRAKSRTKIWIGQALYISIAVLIFFLIGFFVVAALSQIILINGTNNWFHVASSIYNIPSNIGKYQIIAQMFILLYLTSLCAVLLQSLISMLTKNVLIPLILIMAFHIFAINSGRINVFIVRWILGNQSMIVRHTLIDENIKNFSIQWSVVYNIVLILLILIIGVHVINKMDILIEEKN